MLIFASRIYCAALLLLLFICSTEAIADASTVTIVTQNLNRFFDNVDDGNKEKVLSNQHYKKRKDQLVHKIVNSYGSPDILLFQEIENRRILQDVGLLLKTRHDLNYEPVLIEGNDQSGIDVGYLIKKPLNVTHTKTLFTRKTYNRKGDRLFSRPPLVIEVCDSSCITVMNVHLRSMRGLRSHKKGHRVTRKRKLQAENIARWVNDFQHEHPKKKLLVGGDFNALIPSDRFVDVVGTILGNPDTQRPVTISKDLIKNDLIDISKSVKKNQRYSFVYKRKRQQLDYILVNKNLSSTLNEVRFTRIDYRFSDHAALLAQFNL